MVKSTRQINNTGYERQVALPGSICFCLLFHFQVEINNQAASILTLKWASKFSHQKRLQSVTLEKISTNLNKEKFSFFDKNLN